MRLKFKRYLIAAACITSALGASAATIENFNSRKGVSTKTLKGFLQGDCWSFRNFDINRDGWNPGIEGDGAMVSGISAGQPYGSGIFTPALNVQRDVQVSFEYKFSNAFSTGTRRWMKVCLADMGNNIVRVLDSFEFRNTGTSAAVYNKRLVNPAPGKYRMVLQYGGSGGPVKIGIDELSISATPVYGGGCNEAPIAKNDVITGDANRNASGSLFANDHDRNKDKLTAYLIKASPDGTVSIADDGSFTFVPNKGFTGNITSFTYKICDNGEGELCSNSAVVTINFPNAGIVPLSLTDFTGSYKNDGYVELKWMTGFENKTDHFEIERSLDGKTWHSTGSIKAQGVSAISHNYAHVDKWTRYTAIKKDLYYRLKQINEDGNVGVSKILVVRVYNTKTVTMISVTPNPAVNDIAVNMQINEAAFVTMRVLDNGGAVLIRKSLKVDQGINSLLVEGSASLKPGAYVLDVIVNSKERMLVKLIKE